MLAAINELTSRQGGFDGPQGKTEVKRTQEGESEGASEEGETRSGSTCQRAHREGQGRERSRRSGQAQDGREEEGRTEAKSRTESDDNADSGTCSAPTRGASGRGSAPSGCAPAAAPRGPSASTEAGDAATAAAQRAGDAWSVAHAAETPGEHTRTTKAAELELGWIRLGWRIGHVRGSAADALRRASLGVARRLRICGPMFWEKDHAQNNRHAVPPCRSHRLRPKSGQQYLHE